MSTIPPHRHVCRISLNLRWVYLPPCSLTVLRFFCDSGEARTRDSLVKSEVLYQLSYEIIVGEKGLEPSCNRLPFLQGISLRGYSPRQSGRQDSNLRPSGPKPDALPPAPLPEIVTPDRFELPLSGPKPLVLPLDDGVIKRFTNISKNSPKIRNKFGLHKS